MSQLGSIFDDVPATTAADKGPDVRVRAEVRRAQLAAGEAVLVPVPDRVAHEGGSVPRRREAGDPPGAVRLHLSPRLAHGATLRLRRQGGEHPASGVPGDLLVEIAVIEPSKRPLVIAVVVAVVAAAGAWLSQAL
jgi:DnaJ-class molecular chaperone